MNIALECNDLNQFEQAQILANEFGIDLIYSKKSLADEQEKNRAPATSTYEKQKVFLSFKNDSFILASRDGLSLDLSFTKDRRYRRSFQSPKKELISKACGWHLGYRNILDLTAGLAMDSVFLAQVGCQVTSLERHPMLFLLLKAAQKKALGEDPNGVWQKLNFICTESSEYLKNNIHLETAPEVIYYDPMYPSTTKTALPGKEMQIFRRLLGENEADLEVLELAIMKTAKLVVVKRPIKALPLHTNSNISPTRSYLGKLVRFDVYSR